MANNSQPVPVRQSRKSNIKHTLVIAEQVVLGVVIVGAICFYAGVQFQVSQEASKKAAIQDAIKAVQAAPAVAEASKN
jgi:hypothetical protein